MKMLYLYQGWNSGTNQTLLRAWRNGTPELEIREHDAEQAVLRGSLDKLKALPRALWRHGPAVLWPGTGRLVEATKRSALRMRRLAKAVGQAYQGERVDFTLAIATIWPSASLRPPYFLYTDHTILANLVFPGGRRHVALWRECLPFERQVIAGAAMVFTMSDHVTRSLAEHYGMSADRVLRVNGGCNAPPGGTPDPSRFQRKDVLFVGLDWRRKGGADLLKAFGRVRQHHPSATLTIVGSAPNVAGPGVRIIGQVRPDKVGEHMAQASLFCMPTHREAFGFVYLEAMRAGLPVIAGNVGAAPDFIIDGQTGYKVDPGDVTTLARRIDQLLSDPSQCEAIGQRAKTLVESQYTWELTQRRMWDAMRAALARPGEGGDMPTSDVGCSVG